MTGMEDSDRSLVSSALRSAAEIRKATTKRIAPRHILYFQNESTHFTHPPFTDNVERYLIENVISSAPPPRPIPVVQIKTWRSAVGNCSRQRNEYHVWRKWAWNKIKNKTKQAVCCHLQRRDFNAEMWGRQPPVTVTYFKTFISWNIKTGSQM